MTGGATVPGFTAEQEVLLGAIPMDDMDLVLRPQCEPGQVGLSGHGQPWRLQPTPAWGNPSLTARPCWKPSLAALLA